MTNKNPNVRIEIARWKNYEPVGKTDFVGEFLAVYFTEDPKFSEAMERHKPSSQSPGINTRYAYEMPSDNLVQVERAFAEQLEPLHANQTRIIHGLTYVQIYADEPGMVNTLTGLAKRLAEATK